MPTTATPADAEASAAQTPTSDPRPARGAIGREVYERVNARRDRCATISEAISEVAAEMSMSAGNASAHYYRVARRDGVALPTRGRGGRRKGSDDALAATRTLLADARRAIDAADEAVTTLAASYATQTEELERLRAMERRMRRMLGDLVGDEG